MSNLSIFIKNAEIITVNDKNELLKNSCVGISGDSIDYVGEYSDELASKYGKVIDAKGGAVMPGLINTHTHMPMTMFRNYADDMKLMDWLFSRIFPLEDKLDYNAAYWGTCLAALEMIKSGTTAYAEMYFFMDAVAKATEDAGIRGYLGRGLTGETGLNVPDERIRESDELFEKYNGSCDGRLKVIMAPHSVYTCSYDYLKKVSQRAEELKAIIHIHISETKDEVKNCIQKYGVSPVVLLDNLGLLNERTLAAHCVVVDDKDIEILKNRGVNVAHNPGSNLKLASGIAPVDKMLKAGINVSLGTDGAASNNNLDMFEEMRTAAYLQKVTMEDPTVLPVDTVLRMATVNGAKALHEDRLGVIEKGMLADLLIINMEKPYHYPRYNTKSSIVYSGNAGDVESVIVNGKLIMEMGKVLTLDEERIYYEVQKASEKLVL